MIILILILLPVLLKPIYKNIYFKIMTNIVFIYYMSGNIFQEIKYNDFTDLSYQLKLLIINNDSDSELYITLLLDGDILNNSDTINIIKLSKLNNKDIITIIFNQKKELYCLANEYGTYILDYKYDNYAKLLRWFIPLYRNDSYDIIMNNSYKDLVLMSVKKNGHTLQYASNYLKKDKEIVLAAVKENGYSLRHADHLLQIDKEIILESIKQKNIH